MSKKRTKASARHRAAATRQAASRVDLRPGPTAEQLAAGRDLPGPQFGMSRGFAASGVSDEQWQQLHDKFAQEHPRCPDCGSPWAVELANEEEGVTFDGQLVLTMYAPCDAFDQAESDGEEPAPHPISQGTAYSELAL